MAIQTKDWWKSTTVWINLAGMLALVLDFIVRSGAVVDADVIAIILAVVNIIRRFQVTGQVKKLNLP